MINDPDISRYCRAAKQRLTSAMLLFRNHHSLDAMYLGGYAPECALKALLLSRIPQRDRREYVTRQFRGMLGHNFEWLKSTIRRQGITIPMKIAESIRRVQTWSPDLRYEVGFRRADETKLFLDSSQQILEWVLRSL